jgi:hypothetical protein
MTGFDVCLSSAAIQNIVTDQIQEDFEFVVGGQEYKCSRIIAEFLSSRVRVSHSVDPSIAEYFVETSDSNDEFKLFMSLGSGSTIRVTKANLDFFASLSREFHNSNLYISLMEHFDDHFIVSQMRDSTTLDLFSDALIGRISWKFHGLTCLELNGIPVSVLLHILSHDLLKISSEDALFSYVSSRICSDPEYLYLLQFVHFEYVSSECICHFLSAVPDLIDGRLWESISRRLISHVPHAIEFLLNESKPLDGIIRDRTREYRGNVHDKGIVTITSKSVFADFAPLNVAGLNSDRYFTSKDEPGQWVCWDFHEMRVRPTHYTIRSHYLESWVVESSLDGEAWTEIDRKTAHRILGGYGSFAVSNSAEFRFIRLTRTTQDPREKHELSICAVEFFGILVE